MDGLYSDACSVSVKPNPEKTGRFLMMIHLTVASLLPQKAFNLLISFIRWPLHIAMFDYLGKIMMLHELSLLSSIRECSTAAVGRFSLEPSHCTSLCILCVFSFLKLISVFFVFVFIYFRAPAADWTMSRPMRRATLCPDGSPATWERR